MFLTPIPPNVNTTVGAPRRLLCYLECKIAPASESTQGSGGSKFLLTSAPQHWSDGGALPPHRSAKLRRLPVLGLTPCVELRRGVNRKLITGAALHRLSKRHDSSRNVIRTWVPNYGVGDFDEDAAASKALQQYEARIAALERLVGKQALE